LRASALMLLAGAALSLLGGPAAAHFGGLGPAVETRLDIPPWVVWVTGATVVAVSFVVVGAFLTRADAGLPARALASAHAKRSPPRASQALGLAGLGLCILAGLLPGAQGLWPAAALWLVLWAALPVVAYTLGDPWPRLSPFHALAPLADRARRGAAPRALPSWVGASPAVLLLLGLVGFESFSAAQDSVLLGRLALAYTLLTFAGMARYGSADWLAEAEVFTRVFRWWGAVAPVGRDDAGKLGWRGFGGGLAALEMRGWSDVAFTVALLYGVNYDGFLATATGQAALRAGAGLGTAGAHAVVLVAGYALFLGAFVACVHLVRRAAESLAPVPRLACAFAAALVPIAVGYHAAHNLFYAWEHAPRVLFALADPLGLGWSLFHVPGSTRLPLPQALVPVLGTVQMLLILAGHVLAVVVAHRLAFAAFPSRVQAVRSELPLTGAMVFYTLVGLWILSSAVAPLPAPPPFSALPGGV